MSQEYFVNKIPLHPHKFTLLYSFFSTSVMINFYLYLTDFLTQVFLLTSLKKTRWILRPAQEELQREGCREKTTKKLPWSLTPTLSPLRRTTLCQSTKRFTCSYCPTFLSALLSCSADSKYASYKWFYQ